jgi:hypothetical protein
MCVWKSKSLLCSVWGGELQFWKKGSCIRARGRGCQSIVGRCECRRRSRSCRGGGGLERLYIVEGGASLVSSLWLYYSLESIYKASDSLSRMVVDFELKGEISLKSLIPIIGCVFCG